MEIVCQIGAGLAEEARACGTIDLYTGDDGKLYLL
jgi:hypothetical protein